MFTEASALLIITLLWLKEDANSALIGKEFWQYRLSSDFVRSKYIFITSASTPSACGNLCTGFPTCQSFGFNSGSLTCWLYDHLVVYTTNGAAAPGTRYFWRLSPRCPTELNYTLEEGLCFKVHQENMNVTEAREVCAGEGGTLAIVDTVAKLDLLMNYVTFRAWVGGSDSEAKGEWRWEDGGRLDITSPLWRPGKPDGRRGEQRGLSVVRDGGLDDGKPEKEFPAVCEQPLL